MVGKTRILFVASVSDLYRLGAVYRTLTLAGYKVEETDERERLAEAMLDGSVDIVFVRALVRLFAPVIQQVRKEGSATPVVYVHDGREALPEIDMVIWRVAAATRLASEFIQAINEALAC